MEYVGEPRPLFWGERPATSTVPSCTGQQIPDQPQRRRFAVSGRTEKADELSVPHAELSAS